MKNVTENWGKDHWSLLAYLETCAVDHKGVVNLSRIRINEAKRGFTNGTNCKWQESWGTRMKGGVIPDGKHDDIDVLEELEAAGFVDNIATNLHPCITMKPKGLKVVNKIRVHKANGGMFATFSL